ncbi:hypothetical protein INR49_019436 [Caranx melampygus]|nr:hypothetical protein INR49_019436 [Caranx melampygus]
MKTGKKSFIAFIKERKMGLNDFIQKLVVEVNGFLKIDENQNEEVENNELPENPSGPTDLRHFDPEFTHLPVSSSLCTDAPTGPAAEGGGGAFPGFSYGPPADHSSCEDRRLCPGSSREQDSGSGLDKSTVAEEPGGEPVWRH